jgi:uncharacterized protein (TIGR03435 family)
MKIVSLTAMFLAAMVLAVYLVAPPLALAQPQAQDSAQGHAQDGAQVPAQDTVASSVSSSGAMPQFDVATIKPPDPKAQYRMAGFNGYPGGRVFFGGHLDDLVEFAYGLQSYQLGGGSDWTRSEWFEINALPPENSSSRTIAIQTAEPTAEQRQMIQSLLRDRFGLKFHMETKEGEVFILSRGSKELQLKPPKDPKMDPRAIVFMRSTGDDGEAEGTNTTTDYLAERLGRYLQLPVLNQTGIAGSYDFYLPPVDPENKDIAVATYSVVDRLGLKIKRSRGPIQTLVIDQVDHPNAN